MFSKYILVLVCCFTLALGCGCASSEQCQKIRSWGQEYTKIDRARLEEGKSVLTSELMARLGKPDYVLKGKELDNSISDCKVRHYIMEVSARSFPELGRVERVPDWVTERLCKSEFWFYDEAMRYPFQSQPRWGMGCGYVVIWFVVNEKGEVITQGFGGFETAIAPTLQKE